MKNAVIAAIVAALVSSGSTLAATHYINGAKIKPHSIAANRLTPKALKTISKPTRSALAPKTLAAAVNSTIDYEQATSDITVSPQTFTVSCPVGDVAVGGGYQTSADVEGGGATENSVTPDFTGWTVTVGGLEIRNDGSTPTLTVYVACEPAGG